MEKEIFLQLAQRPIIAPEFTREVPGLVEADRTANAVAANRRQLLARAEGLGLDYGFLLKQRQFLVGPFVSPAPLPTTFNGSPEQIRSSFESGKQIASRLNVYGLPATQYATVTLAITEMPREGAEFSDCFIVPKNVQENQKLRITQKPKYNQPYQTVKTSSLDDLTQKLTDTGTTFLQRFPELKRQGKGKNLIGSVVADVRSAYDAIQTLYGEVRYLPFAAYLNSLIGMRVNLNTSLPSISVDSDIYQPFLQNGITNIAQFARKLDDIGFFENDPSFVKTISDNGYTVMLDVQDIGRDDIQLRAKDRDWQISYSELKNSGAPLAPCKDLSYLLCFSNMVPVVYGSQNSGDYYGPYAEAKSRVQKLGFTPTMYRTQPQISDGLNTTPTVFEFYQQLLP